MKTLQKEIRSGIIIGVSFLSTVLLGGVMYAAYSSLSVNTNDTLSASKWNELVTYAVPPGGVMAFYGTNCPANWSPADGTVNGVKKTDGTSGTLDLRGEFIRGLDTAGVGSRGVDAARTLASAQNATRVFYNEGDDAGYEGRQLDMFSSAGIDYDGSPELALTRSSYTALTAGGIVNNSKSYGIRTRPRNVALLYCVKN